MKLACLVLATALNPVLGGDLTQTNQAKPLDRGSVPPAAATLHSEPFFPGGCGTKENELPHAATNFLAATNLPILDFKAGKPPSAGIRALASPPVRLKPGVYKTLPYTCLVLVPGMVPDDISAGCPGAGWMETMPRLEPDLKFVPWPPVERK